MNPVIEKIKGGLVVSCQAYPGEPLRHPETMAQMAMAAVEGGAVGIRCQGLSDISAIKGQVDVPVIGIWKDGHEAFILRQLCATHAAVLLLGQILLRLMLRIDRVQMV